MAIKASNQISLVDVTDAYSVILTSEAYTFVGSTSGVGSGSSCTTQAVAYCGTNQCSTVTVDASAITCPTGISATVTNSGTSSPTITFTTTATVSSACEATIPVTVDGITINKKFSFAVAKTGTSGTSVTVKSTSVTYQASSSGTTTPTGTWSTSIPTVSNGGYLWTKTVVTYSDGASTTSYSVSYKGTNGTNGTSVTVKSTSVTYQASSSGTTTPTGTWATSVPSTSAGQYLWTKTVVTYSDGNSTTSYSVSRNGSNGTNGKDGTDGADAITLSITTSNGTVFKNSSGSTILTAHVYKAGQEINVDETTGAVTDATGTAIGTIKWYSSASSSTVLATAATLTVSATDVSSVAAYTCQLESED